MLRSTSSVGSKKGRTYYYYMSENKDISKSLSYLSTSINSMKDMVIHALKPFNRYERVWKVDREAMIQEFLEQSPCVNEFRLEINDYLDLGSQVSGNLVINMIVMQNFVYCNPFTDFNNQIEDVKILKII